MAITLFRPDGIAPATTRSIPVYPVDKPQRVPFFRMYNDDGEPLDWMRAGSPIDGETGVYVLLDTVAADYYVGSSLGNVRRTLARHFQQWERTPVSQYVTKFRGKGARMTPPGVTVGGVLFERDATAAAVFLVDDSALRLYPGARAGDDKAPRQIEAWIYDRLCSRRTCRGINDLAERLPF